MNQRKRIDRLRKQWSDRVTLFKTMHGSSTKNDKGHFTQRNCPVCGNNEYRYLLTNSFDQDIVKCQRCSMAYMNPVLREDHILNQYTESERTTNKHDIWKNYLQKLRPAQKPGDPARFKMLIDHTNRGKLLEYGCGFARNLDSLKFYFDSVEGIDIDPYCTEHAQKIFGITVHSDIQNVENRYDACLSYNNIEHLLYPTDILGKIYLAMKEGGVIFIECPNIDATSIKLFKGQTHTLSSEHLNLFSRETLSQTLKQAGFNVIVCSERKVDFTINELLTLAFKPKEFFHRYCHDMFDNKYYKWLCSLGDYLIAKLATCRYIPITQAYIQIVAKKQENGHQDKKLLDLI